MKRRLPDFWPLLLALIVISISVACTGRDRVTRADPGGETSGEPRQDAGESAHGTLGLDAVGMERDATGTVIYFDFDSSDIRPEFRDVISRHAHRLGTAPTLLVRLEGHADERGSREYNIGLGERRAQAVRRALLLNGARDSQLSTVSYGEERPSELGNDETAWSRNRRVEIIDGAPR